MLTLKVITKDQEGNSSTHLFSGDSISHREYFSSDHCIVSKVQQNSSMARIIGLMLETSSGQKFTVSDVKIYDNDHSYTKNELFILPKADCYIMEDGKTVDSFFCQFEQ